MNLLEKQLSTVYFKDVRFPWFTLYKVCNMKDKDKILLSLYKHNSVVSDEERNKCVDNELGITYGKYSFSPSVVSFLDKKEPTLPME